MVYRKLISLLFFALTTSAVFAEPGQNIKERTKEALSVLLTDLHATPEQYAEYIDTDKFSQVVNGGQSMNYADYLQHRAEKKASLASAKLTIKKILTEKNNVATIHIAEGTNNDGQKSRALIHAFITFNQEGKILHWEQVVAPLTIAD